MTTTNTTGGNQGDNYAANQRQVIMNSVSEMKEIIARSVALAEIADHAQFNIVESVSFVSESALLIGVDMDYVTDIWLSHEESLEVEMRKLPYEEMFATAAYGVSAFFKIFGSYDKSPVIDRAVLTVLGIKLLKDVQAKLNTQVPEMYREEETV